MLNDCYKKIDQNIEILESYKELPKDVNRLIYKKQEYLEQILCNIEAISSLTWDWITKNGQRFKTWIELYVLIKSILKSWQLLIDVFINYESECHECKNERSDALDFQFKLIDAVIPKIPVIQFPKWPDIILDLHQVRADIDITLPEFNITTRPLDLPGLPELKLPDTPSASLSLPTIALLPTFELPELPDLPTLPAIILPDLPPAPTLPKMFASLEWVLDILKLITKALCLLKQSPLTPEWRAGDQIAFLTERTGFLSIDFLDINFPQFTLPFVDAIEVTSQVNYEIETDFIVEMVRQAVLPINLSSSRLTNITGFEVTDLDFSNTPNQYDVELDAHMQQNISIATRLMVYKFGRLVSYMSWEGKQGLTTGEFKQEVSRALSHPIVTTNPRMKEIRELWDGVLSMTYSNQEKHITDLEKNNIQKFRVLKNIIWDEIIETKALQRHIEGLWENGPYIQVSQTFESEVQNYNEVLAPFNKRSFEAARELVTPSEDIHKQEIVALADDVFHSVEWWLLSFENNYLVSDTSPVVWSEGLSCQATQNSDYHYNYDGIFISEGGVNYKLFDYTEPLTGREKILPIDMDNDGDNDLIYTLNGRLYIKENYTNTSDKNFVTDSISLVSPSNNPYYINEEFIPAVPSVDTSISADGIINMSFSSIWKHITNYRLEYFDRIDAHRNHESNSYVPRDIRSHIVDAIVSQEAQTSSHQDNFTINNVSRYISDLWSDLSGIEVQTKKMHNLRNDIQNGKQVSLSKWTKVYAGHNSSALKYKGDEKEETVLIPKHQFIEFKEPVDVIGITGSVFVETQITQYLKWEEIRTYIGMPVLWEFLVNSTSIPVSSRASFIELTSQDSGKFALNFYNIASYELYDLGQIKDEYNISLQRENDFLYGLLIWSKRQYYLSKNWSIFTFSSIWEWYLSSRDFVSRSMEDSGIPTKEFRPEWLYLWAGWYSSYYFSRVGITKSWIVWYY